MIEDGTTHFLHIFNFCMSWLPHIRERRCSFSSPEYLNFKFSQEHSLYWWEKNLSPLILVRKSKNHTCVLRYCPQGSEGFQSNPKKKDKFIFEPVWQYFLKGHLNPSVIRSFWLKWGAHNDGGTWKVWFAHDSDCESLYLEFALSLIEAFSSMEQNLTVKENKKNGSKKQKLRLDET